MFGIIGYKLGKSLAEIPLPNIHLVRIDELPTPSVCSIGKEVQLESRVVPCREFILSVVPPSKNLLYSIGIKEPSQIPLLTEPCKTFDCLERLLSLADVSDNLFEPLVACSILGKRYSTGSPHSISENHLFPVETKERKTRRTTPKAYTVTKTSTGALRKFLTIWDLILPMLQPPLDYEFAEQLLLPHELYNFQKSGVTFLLNNKGALLADEMGTGKTVTTVVALRVLFQKGLVKKALVACPKTAMSVWTEHLYDWADPLEVTMVSGTAERRELDWRYPAHVYLISYDTLRSDISGGAEISTEEYREKFDLVVLDEAHHIRNPGSGRARAVKLFSPNYRWALTGTPIQNSLDDLVAIFDFVKPNYLRSEGLTGSRAKKLIEPYFRRIEKKDAFKDLPPKIRAERWLDLDDDQLAEYKSAENREFENIRKMEKVTQFHIFSMIQRLKQICNFAQNKESSPKLELVVDLVEDISESGKKVLIFSQYKEQGIEKLEKPLEKFGFVKITGESSNTHRQQAISQFQEDPDKHVYLATVKAGGEGITLTKASYVIHFDHWWNPAVMWQAEDRAHRKGQQETVNIYSLWMRGTIDERIHHILERKGLLHQEVVVGLSEKDIDQFVSTEEWLEGLGIKPRTQKVAYEPESRQKQSASEVLAKLETCDPLKFEQIIKDLFRKLGYPNARTTKQSHDGGVDIIASRHTVGGQERIVVQCKRRTATLGEGVARELLGVIAADTSISRGFLVSSGEVSTKCRSFCEQDGRLSCLAGVELARYLIQFDIQV